RVEALEPHLGQPVAQDGANSHLFPFPALLLDGDFALVAREEVAHGKIRYVSTNASHDSSFLLASPRYRLPLQLEAGGTPHSASESLRLPQSRGQFLEGRHVRDRFVKERQERT